MATKVDETSLTCAICLRRFRKPRMLPCLHSYCEDCLVEYTQSGTEVMMCPLCQEKVQVPDGDVTKFKLDFRLQSQVEDANRYDKETGVLPEVLTCNCCRDEADAIANCTECDRILCRFGMKAHDNLACLRDHSVALLNEDEILTVRKQEMRMSSTVKGESTDEFPIEKRAILVSNVPRLQCSPERVRDRLVIHFQKTRHGGGDVEGVIYPLEGRPHDAVVVFADQKNCESVLKCQQYISDFKTNVSVEAFPQVFKQVEAEINPFYWNLVPRLQTEMLIDTLSKMVGKNSLEKTKHVLLKIICKIDQLQLVQNAIVKAVGLTHSSRTSQSVIDSGIFVTSIPFLTNDSEELKDELKKHLEIKGISKLESIICPIKGNTQEAIALFKSKKDRDGYIRQSDKCFYGETLSIVNLPPILHQIKAHLGDFFVILIRHYGIESFRDMLHSSCGSNMVTNYPEVTGNSEQIMKAAAAILSIIDLESTSTAVVDKTNEVATQTPVPRQNTLATQTSARTLIDTSTQVDKEAANAPDMETCQKGIDMNELTTHDQQVKITTGKSIKVTRLPQNVDEHTRTKNGPISSSHDKGRSRPPSKIGKVFPGRNMREIPKPHNSQYEASGKHVNLTMEDTDPQSPLQRGPFAVIPLLYHYMLLRHSDEIQAIQEQHRARFEMKVLPDSSEGMVTILGVHQNVAVECLMQAEDAFVTFYKKYFEICAVKILRSDVSDENFEKAYAEISFNFPDILIDNKVEGEISFVGKKIEIPKAMKVFQEASGLAVPKRLRANPPEDESAKSEDVNAIGNFQHNSRNTDYVRSGARPRIQQRQYNDFFGKKDDYSLRINSVEISIVEDDITHQRASIIVSPSNENLTHNGGVASALSVAAGWELQEECNRFRKENNYRDLSVGECIATKGYKLACDRVIHVVGPIFGEQFSDKKFYQDLKTTFFNCLTKASTFPDAKSIAIPLVSSGTVGGPKDLCASALFDALQEFGQSGQRGNIQKIYLVNRDKDATSALIEASRKAEGNTPTTDSKYWDPDAEQTPIEVDYAEYGKSPGPPDHHLNTVSSTETGHSFEWKSSAAHGNRKRKTFQSKIGMRITIVLGDFQNCSNIDVLVNPSSDSSLQTGIGKVIAEAAGDRLVKEYNTKRSSGAFPPSDGDIITTSGYNIQCDKVVHVHISRPTTGISRSGKTIFYIVRDAILKCLKHADFTLRSRSLLLPIEKYGGGDHTPDLYAEAVADAIKNLKSAHQLREIYVVHPNLEMYMALEGVFGDHFTVASDEGSVSTEIGGLKDDKEKEMTERDHFRNRAPGNSYGINDDGNSEDEINSQDDDDEEDKRCPICFEDFAGNTNIEKLGLCKHKFSKPCIDRAMKIKPACPVCGKMYGVMKGNQPTGTMTSTEYRYSDLPGYPGCGYIQINYSFSGGTQGQNHPNPGKYYSGTSRTAYLPNNREGQQVLKLLKKAFVAKLTFTIGTSVTTGMSDTVTWNDIHHKTSMHGGLQLFGYPDPTYLKRVTEKLAAKGIK